MARLYRTSKRRVKCPADPKIAKCTFVRLHAYPSLKRDKLTYLARAYNNKKLKKTKISSLMLPLERQHRTVIINAQLVDHQTEFRIDFVGLKSSRKRKQQCYLTSFSLIICTIIFCVKFSLFDAHFLIVHKYWFIYVELRITISVCLPSTCMICI